MPSYSIVLVLVYLISVNLLGFILMGTDKKKAAMQQWRIPERTFFLIASIGGSIGEILGMNIFRHKTKHLAFSLGIPLILAAQILVFAFLHFYH